MVHLLQRLKTDAVLRLVLFLFVAYTDLFLVSIGLFVIYPDTQKPTALALLPPIFCILIIGIILFKQLPALKHRRPRLYRVGLLFPSLSLVAFLSYADWIISRMNPDNFHALVTKWDAVYFTITTMATVGYGDIYPQSQLARIWVDAQIIIGVVFVGFIIQREIMAERPGKNKK